MSSDRHPIEQARLPGGAFAMGDPYRDGFHADGETLPADGSKPHPRNGDDTGRH